MLMKKTLAGTRALLSPGVVNKEGNRSLAAYARVQCTMCKILQAIYTSDGSAGDPITSMSDLEAALDSCNVKKSCNLHRRPDAITRASDGEEGRMLMYEEKVMLQQFLAAFPDILQASGGSGERDRVLHFAPASVLHLLETAMFAALLKSGQLSSADQHLILEAYPNKTVLRGAGLTLYHLKKGGDLNLSISRQSQHDPPVEGAQVAPLPEIAVRELCSFYAGIGLDSKAPLSSNLSKTSQLPDSISIFSGEIGTGHDNCDDDSSDGSSDASSFRKRVPLHYFVLHNPTTKSVGKFLTKWNEGERKSKLTGKKDCYGGLVEKERVAAVEFGRTVRENREKRRAINRRDSDVDKDENGKTRSAESTVPAIALLVGVELPHRKETPEIVEQNEIPASVKSKDSGMPVSGLSVGGFCRWRGCLCKGVKVSFLVFEFSARFNRF